MEFFEGERVKDVLNNLPAGEQRKVASLIGETAGMLHAAGVVHGDLTTSNMILSGGKLFLVDFGLAKVSGKTEDQAVDLFLLYEALKSAHFTCFQEVWGTVLNAYKQKYLNSNNVMNRLTKIEKRRRYKS
jgi:TP53 regulating kinase-like protein